MKFKNVKFFIAALLLSAIFAIVPGCKGGAEAKDSSNNKTNTEVTEKEPGNKTETSESVQRGVDSLSQGKVDEKRKKIMKDAIAAIRETENAIIALDSNKTKEALQSLEKATGKLELILAREPKLALAPMDVEMTTYDVLTTLESIKAMRKNAKKLMNDGMVQEARRLITNLRSEIVVSVVNIPLATYPNAIKAITPLIDKGKLKEAKLGLAQALNTLIVTDHIIPLPVIRAEEMLKSAEKIAENKERKKEENDTLSTLLENARYQLKMAEALGYGKKKEYKAFYEQLDEIVKKTSDGKSGDGFFDNIKDSIGAMRKRIFK